MIEYYKNFSLENLLYINKDGLVCEEVFKNVPNYEGYYQVSDLGRVKSLLRKSNNWQSVIFKKEIILKQGCNKKLQYQMVGLTDSNSKTTTKYVHILVCQSFLGYSPNRTTAKVADHIDRNRKNNVLHNLQIISHRENCTKDRKQNVSSKYVGVWLRKDRGSWVTSIGIKGVQIRIASFKNEEQAHNAYKIALLNEDKFDGDVKKFREEIKNLIANYACF
jgi:hypothetical protein